jgi:beta-carotene hydroxylase
VTVVGEEAAPGRPPPLPRRLYQPDNLRGAAFALHSVALFVVPAWAAVRLDASAVFWPVRALGLVGLWLLAQQGLHLLGWVGHEGFHLSLHRNKYVSAVMGVVVSSLVFLFAQVGVALTHWAHHRYTNQAEDPDLPLFSPHRSLARRLLLGRVVANRSFLINLLRIASGRRLPVANLGPFRRPHLRALAWLNLLVTLGFAAGYVCLAVRAPRVALVGVVVPHALGILLSGLRPYLEHAGTAVGMFRDARTYSSPVMTALFAGNNFHLEHHLYPSIPCWRLPAVHRYLAQAGYYRRADVAIERTFWGAVAHARARSRYPDTGPPGTAAPAHD